ncbi:MAG: hypothetical protein ABII06_10635 [Pseudomonadota bacterium]
MENKDRGLASHARETPHLIDGTHDENRLTVMIMKSVGKVRSFKISSRILFLAAMFFLLYIIASILVINQYLEIRRESLTRSTKIRDLDQGALKNSRELERSRQQIAFLEDYIRNLEEGQEKIEEPKEAPKPAKVEKKGEERQAELPKPPAEKDQEPAVAAPAEVVGIQDLAIQREGSQIAINLKIVNIHPDDGAVGGYIHIIAEGEKFVPPEEWTYPRETLQGGLPVNFRKGQPFRIQRFKPFRARFKMGPDGQLPSAIRVLIYDQSGAVMLKKEFEVGNAL